MFVKVSLLLTSFFVITPIADTIWWNTSGGRVVGHKDERGTSCTLFLTNSDGTISFTWEPDKQPLMSVIKSDWQFADNDVNVAVRIGTTWLDNGNGSPNIEAIETKSSVLFQLDQSIDDLLYSSDQIQVIVGNDAYFQMALPKDKMNALMAGVKKCRSA